MIVMSVVAALAVLALATQAGVVAVQRAFPPQGRMIGVDGATLHVVDIGPRRAGLPIVMLHGASSNLDATVPATAGARARDAGIRRRRSRRA